MFLLNKVVHSCFSEREKGIQSHEPMLPSHYSLNYYYHNSSNENSKTLLLKQFVDILATIFSSNKLDCFFFLQQMLVSLLLPQHVRLRAQLQEVLDMDLIQQKMENDAFDIFYYANYVVDTMSRLCAPVRDKRVARLRDSKEVVPLFK